MNTKSLGQRAWEYVNRVLPAWTPSAVRMALFAFVFLALAGQAMAQTITNTADGIYNAVATPFASTFDKLLGLAVGILVVLVVYGLVRSWIGRRKGKMA